MAFDYSVMGECAYRMCTDSRVRIDPVAHSDMMIVDIHNMPKVKGNGGVTDQISYMNQLLSGFLKAAEKANDGRTVSHVRKILEASVSQ